MTSLTNNSIKTAVRHGDKNVLVQWLKEQGYDSIVTEGSRDDLKSLEPADRVYGQLHSDSKILLVDAGDQKGIATRYWHFELKDIK